MPRRLSPTMLDPDRELAVLARIELLEERARRARVEANALRDTLERLRAVRKSQSA